MPLAFILRYCGRVLHFDRHSFVFHYTRDCPHDLGHRCVAREEGGFEHGV